MDIAKTYPDLYPRRCEQCGQGMRRGYIFGDCEAYCEACSLPEEVAEGDAVWTEWIELEDNEAYSHNGSIITIVGPLAQIRGDCVGCKVEQDVTLLGAEGLCRSCEADYYAGRRTECGELIESADA